MNGFKPVRTMGGNAQAFHAQKYPVNASNGSPIYQGDAVVLVSGGVQSHSADGTRPVLGVCKASYRGTGKNRPNTHRLPDNGNFIEASQTGWVEVYIDPDIVYEVATDSAASNLSVGRLADIVDASAHGSAGNNNTGLSRSLIDGSTIAAETTANVISLPFIVTGIAGREKVTNTSGAGYDFGVGSSGVNIEVMIHNHIFRPRNIAYGA